MVRARGLAFGYTGGASVLTGFDIDIPAGVTGIIGVNGIGKSTFLRLCLGLLRPRAGDLEVLGQVPAASGGEIRARIGYVPEQECLPRDTSAVSFVERMARLAGVPSRRARDRAVDALQLVGLGEEALRPIGGYSTGQRQRVRLAQALAHGPELIFLDEPTNGLDPTGREAVLTLLARLGRELDVSMVLTSHLLPDLRRVCGRVLEIRPEGVRVALEQGAGGPRTALLLRLLGPVDPTLEQLRMAGLEATRQDGRDEGTVRVLARSDADLDGVRDAIVTARGALLSMDWEERRSVGDA